MGVLRPKPCGHAGVTEAPPTEEELARFYSHVEKLPCGCHFWNGARSRGKNRSKKWYGSFRYRGKVIRAHRFAHDHIGGRECPPGYHRDHTCEFSLCVNDEHLEAITHAENERRKRERRASRTDFVDRESILEVDFESV